MILRTFLATTAICACGTLALAQGAPVQLGGPSPAARAIDKAASPPRVATQNAADAVEKANAYFNGIRTMVADFSQVGGNGRRTAGKLYLQKPGRLRFEYDRPSPLEIIADGRSVAVRNRKLAKQDLYFIGQTPLKFLLKQRINLARDVKLLGVRNEGPYTSIHIEDKATFGGTSRIKLFFDTKTFDLKYWTVLDPQGYMTKVSLANIDLKTRPSAELFKINYERLDNEP